MINHPLPMGTNVRVEWEGHPEGLAGTIVPFKTAYAKQRLKGLYLVYIPSGEWFTPDALYFAQHEILSAEPTGEGK